MTQNNNDDNLKKGMSFLAALYKDKPVNLIAIEPESGTVKGITRPVSNTDLEAFVKRYYETHNIYYMVNTPRVSAPDTKLKKNDVEWINAVWLDADPAKDKPFEDERARLLDLAKELMNSRNPPTLITDSGGGIQAFWYLDQPIIATEQTRREFEAFSRGLAEQYKTDHVHNIDRIMRLPHTWNIPTKHKPGRTKTLARCTKIGRIYDPAHLGAFIVPSYAEESSNEVDYSKLDMHAARKPLSYSLMNRLETARTNNKKLDDIWTGKMMEWKPSRSEADFTLAMELKSEGFDLLETAQIMMAFPYGKGGELTAREIVRCYERSGTDFIDSLSPDYVEMIDKQINPLLKSKQDAKAIIDSSSVIWGGQATEKGSGTPLFKHFLNRETVNVLFGPSGSGKSFLTLDMAIHLSLGRNWAGFRCKEKMSVLYICTESGSSFGKRVKAARKRLGVKDDATPQEFPFAYYYRHMNLLKNKDHIKLVMKLIDDVERDSGYKCGLVVVDTLSAAFGGGNENSEDMTAFVDNMAQIKFEKKVAVKIVHHTGKDESAGARGHSSLKGNIDTEIQVRAEKRGNKWHRSFISTKQKDDEIGNMKRFGLQIVDMAQDEDGDPVRTCTVVIEGDTDFDAIAPSIEDELDMETVSAYRAIKYYDAAIKENNHHFEHTEREAKAVIHNAIMRNTGMFEDAKPSLKPLCVMARPTKDSAIVKAFMRSCNKLLEKNIVEETARFRLKLNPLSH